MQILLLHGPNLNLLGTRESHIYGSTTLDSINQACQNRAKMLGHTVVCFQSNAEHELINTMHQSTDSVDFIIINPAAFTHTSIALRDALLAINKPFIEVHLSNIYKREAFRQCSYFSDQALGVISGFGAQSYQLAIDAANDYHTNLKLKN